MTAVTDEFPYYLRPKKAVFSGLICVAMYLMGLVLTTDVSGASGWVGSWWVRQGQAPAAMSVIVPWATGLFPFGRQLAHPRRSPRGQLGLGPRVLAWKYKRPGLQLGSCSG